MSYRKATAQDIDTILDLWWKLHEYNHKFDKKYYAITSEEDALNYKREYYQKIINDDKFVVLMIESNEKEIAGFLVGEIRNRDPFYWANKYGTLLEISVNPKYQNQGLFTKAYGEFLRFLKDDGIDLIDAEIDLENSAPLAAYWKINFYKRAFHLISWIGESEKFMKKLEKKKKLAKKKKERGESTENLYV